MYVDLYTMGYVITIIIYMSPDLHMLCKEEEDAILKWLRMR